MQFVASREAREGMCIAEDICDGGGRVLIARGQRLGLHHLVRLRKFKISSIFIDPANGESNVKPVRSDLRDQCQQVLSESFAQVRQEFASKKVALNVTAIKAATDNLLNALQRAKKPLVTLCDVSASSDRLMQHSVNVSVLGIMLALDLKAPREMLHDLAVALLFHDIGMITLPESILFSEQPPNPEQTAAIQQHARLGFEHLVHSDAISHVASGLILRHHEHLNGSGYPQSLRGENLSQLARIMSVAETYDSLTSGRFGIPAVLPDAAISYIISNAGILFAKEVVVALCRRIALYPVGSAVKLNSGEAGIVAGLLPEHPHRPIVLVHVDNHGRTLKQPMVVDLTSDPRRGISRSASSLPLVMLARKPEHAPPPIDPIQANLG